MAAQNNGAQATARPKIAGKEPFFGILYGPSDSGKSTSLVSAFPMGYFVGPRGGPTKPAQSVYGLKPAARAVKNLEQFDAQLEWAAKKGFDALVSDDLSIASDSTFREAEKDAPIGRSGNVDGFYAYDLVTDFLMAMRDKALGYPMHVFIVGHEKNSFTDKKTGKFYLGTIELPGKYASIHIPPACDGVYRAEKTNAFGLGPGLMSPWNALMRRDPLSAQFFTKCRDDSPDMLPLNIGELMRANGYKLRRAPGLEWMDDLIEAGFNAVYETDDTAEIAAWLKSQIAGIFARGGRPRWLAPGPIEDGKIVRWVIHDLVSRVLIRQAKHEQMAEYALPEVT